MSTALPDGAHRAGVASGDPLPEEATPRPAVTPAALGVVGGTLGLLAGVWLMYAPFAFGYQPEDADWSDATATDFWTGFGLTIVAVLALGASVAALVGVLRANGAIGHRHEQAGSEPEPEPEPESAPEPGPAAGSNDELTSLLRPLIAALERDNAEQAPAPTRPHPTYQER